MDRKKDLHFPAEEVSERDTSPTPEKLTIDATEEDDFIVGSAFSEGATDSYENASDLSTVRTDRSTSTTPSQASDGARTSSDEIHNLNCYLYLKNVVMSDYALSKLRPYFRDSFVQCVSSYQSSIPYGDYYQAFFAEVEHRITPALYAEAASVHPDRVSDLDALVLSLYDNNNHILDETYKNIQQLIQAKRPSDKRIEHLIKTHVSDENFDRNIFSPSPSMKGSRISEISSVLSSTFKPQHETNLSTIRHYMYRDEGGPFKEYRFGTQAQRDAGMVRVSPLFELFLEAQQRHVASSEQPITHIYFNNLPRDAITAPHLKKIAASNEVAFTTVLENLERTHPNIAVITLPAGQGLLNSKQYKDTQVFHDFHQTRNLFINLASEEHDGLSENPGGDFFISPRIRRLLFPAGNAEAVISSLLDKSFHTMGLSSGRALSSAERQAVWVHFLKFELTNYIIETLNPEGINFSCKDAIDRGGVASAYYNLMKSFELNQALTRDEFECALHAAPTMVKGRGMNDQINVIWNAMDQYIKANEKDLTGEKSWLIAWRDANCPPERIQNVLFHCLKKDEVRLVDKLNALDMSDPRSEATFSTISKSIELFQLIRQESSRSPKIRPLLLEIARLTTEICLDNDAQQEKVDRIQRLTNITQELDRGSHYTIPYRMREAVRASISTMVTSIDQRTRPESSTLKMRRAMQEVVSHAHKGIDKTARSFGSGKK